MDLIQQCGHTVQHAFSLQKPATPEELATKKKSKKRKLADGNELSTTEQPSSEAQLQYFPACFPALYDSIPVVGTSKASTQRSGISGDQPEGSRKRPKDSSDSAPVKFPRNLVFYAANWAEEDIETDVDRYDVILAYVSRLSLVGRTGLIPLCARIMSRLSLTKWIHLHGLDEGLVKFFRKCFECIEPGGMLILEKQGWRGYKDAKRSSQVSTWHMKTARFNTLTQSLRLQTLKDNYFKLKLRPEEDFERILLDDIGFSRREAVKDGSSSGKSSDISRRLIQCKCS